MIEALEGMAVEDQRMIYDKVPMYNDRTIADFKVT
jgi:hypothetical protein